MTDGSRKVRSRGRPEKPIPKLDASPEKIARAIFSAAPPPDPKRRIPRRKINKTKESS